MKRPFPLMNHALARVHHELSRATHEAARVNAESARVNLAPADENLGVHEVFSHVSSRPGLALLTNKWCRA